MTGLDQAFNSGITVGASASNGVVVSGSIDADTTINKYSGLWKYIAILFDYIQDETSTVSADITDNWVESNYTLQDHIAIKPRIYRLRGCVGEVLYENVYKFLEKFEEEKIKHPVFSKTIDTVNTISSLSGTVSNYTRAAINVVKQIESSYDRYKKIYDNFTKANQLQGKRQAILYEMLVYMMQNRLPVHLTNLAFGDEVLKELYTYEKNYFIQSVSAHQGNNAYISDIEVTVKEIRVAVTKTTKVDSKQYSGIVANTVEADNGLAKNSVIDTNSIMDAVKESAKAIGVDPNSIGAKIVQKVYNKIKQAPIGEAFKKSIKSVAGGRVFGK